MHMGRHEDFLVVLWHMEFQIYHIRLHVLYVTTRIKNWQLVFGILSKRPYFDNLHKFLQLIQYPLIPNVLFNRNLVVCNVDPFEISSDGFITFSTTFLFMFKFVMFCHAKILTENFVYFWIHSNIWLCSQPIYNRTGPQTKTWQNCHLCNLGPTLLNTCFIVDPYVQMIPICSEFFLWHSNVPYLN